MQTQIQQPLIFQNSVVVFSKNYLPISRVPMKRAITLLVTGRAEALDLGKGSPWIVRSPSLALIVPEHIRLVTPHFEHRWKIPAVSRREVFRRDRHVCQYCGSTHPLTLDHVLPRSRGGLHRWENVVTACVTCNGRKGDRTPQEANMPLKSLPKAPMHPAVAFAEQFWLEG
jgi:5-methylcytosine-specific restriction endonuclease McrA